MPHLSVRDLLSRNFVGVSESDTVRGAVELMREDGETGAVVLRGSEPVGLVSASDILDGIASGVDLSTTPVSEIMHREPPNIRPEASLDEAATALARAGEDHVLVTNEEGVLGLIGARDLAAMTWEPEDIPDEMEFPTRGVQSGQGNEPDVEYSSQSICEACGSLSRDLANVNGQLLCPDCRAV